MESAQNGMVAVLKQTIRLITEAFHTEKIGHMTHISVLT